LYLRETITMTEALSRGEWFGNYGVGVHGFLFKLPVAIVFLFTGPSVFIASISHVLLATLGCYLLYRISKVHLKMQTIPATSVVLLYIGAHQFLTTYATYLREMPAVLVILLLIDAILSKRNVWLIGILLLLLIEAKEHVFFSIAVGYGLWLIYDQYLKSKSFFKLDFYTNFIYRSFASFFPIVVYLILMFATSIIPMNMFNAYIFQLTTWGTLQVTVEHATENTQGEEGKEIARIPQTITDENNPYARFNPAIELVNDIVSYVGKIFYPRTFGFLSTPLIITIPAFIMSLYSFRKWQKEKKREWLILCFLYWGYLLTYMLHRGHGRYLFPISPVAMIFFVLFLTSQLKKNVIQNILLDIAVAISISVFFESNYVLPKIGLHIVMFSTLAGYFYLRYRHKVSTDLLLPPFAIIFTACTAVVGLAYMMSVDNRGYIIRSLYWGYSYEAPQIVSLVDDDTPIWINNIDWAVLPFFYRKDDGIDPLWYWKLYPWIPKNDLAEYADIKRTFSANWETEEDFKELVIQSDIEKLILVNSTLKDYPFDNEYNPQKIESFEWTMLETTRRMQNKKVYIFDVREDKLYQ
jgi:hypothetical protein